MDPERDDFEQLYADIEAEAQNEGSQAVAELEGLKRYYSIYGQFLELRKLRGMTQTQLAKASGINQAEISRIERGTANPTLATLETLLRKLGGELHVVARAGR